MIPRIKDSHQWNIFWMWGSWPVPQKEGVRGRDDTLTVPSPNNGSMEISGRRRHLEQQVRHWTPHRSAWLESQLFFPSNLMLMCTLGGSHDAQVLVFLPPTWETQTAQSSCLWPGPALVVIDIWGVNTGMQKSISISCFPNKMKKKIRRGSFSPLIQRIRITSDFSKN